MWPFTLFKRKKNTKKIPARTLEELKVLTKVLFIDDKAFKVVDNIKEKERALEYKRLRRLEELEEKNRRVEEVKQQKQEIFEQRRKMNRNMEKEKEKMIRKFDSIMKN